MGSFLLSESTGKMTDIQVQTAWMLMATALISPLYQAWGSIETQNFSYAQRAYIRYSVLT